VRTAPGVAILALIIAAGVTTQAQTVRSGDLPNLAEGMAADAGSSATAADGKYGPPRALDGDGGTRWATRSGSR